MKRRKIELFTEEFSEPFVGEFSDERITAVEGKYVYFLRHEDDNEGEIATIEPSVKINFFGVVILNEPIVDWGSDEGGNEVLYVKEWYFFDDDENSDENFIDVHANYVSADEVIENCPNLCGCHCEVSDERECSDVLITDGCPIYGFITAKEIADAVNKMPKRYKEKPMTAKQEAKMIEDDTKIWKESKNINKRRMKMLKCPRCGNIEKFNVGVSGIADYDQTEDSFDEIQDSTIDNNKSVVCRSCNYDGAYSEFVAPEYWQFQMDTSIILESKEAVVAELERILQEIKDGRTCGIINSECQNQEWSIGITSLNDGDDCPITPDAEGC